jgi:hypothetical protein
LWRLRFHAGIPVGPPLPCYPPPPPPAASPAISVSALLQLKSESSCRRKSNSRSLQTAICKCAHTPLAYQPTCLCTLDAALVERVGTAEAATLPQAKMEAVLSTEIEKHCCPVCYELMVLPSKTLRSLSLRSHRMRRRGCTVSLPLAVMNGRLVR